MARREVQRYDGPFADISGPPWRGTPWNDPLASTTSIEVLDQRGIADRFLAEGQVAQVAGFAVSQLRDLTMAGIFFESREPPVSEFSFADLKAAFPEGQCTVRAESFDVQILVGSATFTHDVPAPSRDRRT
jgi:hypothetical protein